MCEVYGLNCACPQAEYAHDTDTSTPCLFCGAGNATDTLAELGAVSCDACAAGRYDHDSDSTTACVSCESGRFSGSGSTACAACLPGFSSCWSAPGVRHNL